MRGGSACARASNTLTRGAGPSARSTCGARTAASCAAAVQLHRPRNVVYRPSLVRRQWRRFALYLRRDARVQCKRVLRPPRGRCHLLGPRQNHRARRERSPRRSRQPNRRSRQRSSEPATRRAGPQGGPRHAPRGRATLSRRTRGGLRRAAFGARGGSRSAPDGVVRAQANPLRNGAVLLLLLAEDALDLERLVGRLRTGVGACVLSAAAAGRLRGSAGGRRRGGMARGSLLLGAGPREAAPRRRRGRERVFTCPGDALPSSRRPPPRLRAPRALAPIPAAATRNSVLSPATRQRWAARYTRRGAWSRTIFARPRRGKGAPRPAIPPLRPIAA